MADMRNASAALVSDDFTTAVVFYRPPPARKWLDLPAVFIRCAERTLEAGPIMAQVEIYSTLFCPYCARAKSLLERKGVDFVNIDVIENTSKRDEMVQRSGGRQTVPQIFIDGEHIGGSDDLAALDRAGRLDAKLGLSPP
jgi:glutaredoxin 3